MPKPKRGEPLIPLTGLCDGAVWEEEEEKEAEDRQRKTVLECTDGIDLKRLDLPVKSPVTCGWTWGTKERQKFAGMMWLFLHKDQSPKWTIFLPLTAEAGKRYSLGMQTVGTQWSRWGAPFLI